MSKPWSQAGIAAEWTEWHALARNYTIGIAIAAVLLWGAGFQCARVHYTRPDPATAQEAHRQQLLEAALRTSEHARDTLTKRITDLRVAQARDVARADSLHREAAQRENAITIDTALAAVALLPAEDSRSSLRAVSPDTVAYAGVKRPTDEREYRVPRFFVDSYLATLADRDAAVITARDAELINTVLTAKVALFDSTDALRDSINASLSREIDGYRRAHQPWCQFKCGVVTTLTALAAAAVTIGAVRR